MMEKKAVAREKKAALRSEMAFAEDTPMDESNDTEKVFDISAILQLLEFTSHGHFFILLFILDR